MKRMLAWTTGTLLICLFALVCTRIFAPANAFSELMRHDLSIQSNRWCWLSICPGLTTLTLAERTLRLQGGNYGADKAVLIGGSQPALVWNGPAPLARGQVQIGYNGVNTQVTDITFEYRDLDSSHNSSQQPYKLGEVVRLFGEPLTIRATLMGMMSGGQTLWAFDYCFAGGVFAYTTASEAVLRPSAKVLAVILTDNAPSIHCSANSGQLWRGYGLISRTISRTNRLPH